MTGLMTVNKTFRD